MRLAIPSVHYADLLAVTLPAWVEKFPNAAITVVTAPGDTATAELAKTAGVRVVVTAAWYANGHKFDKAAALDEALGFGPAPGHVPGVEPPAKGERVLAIDADVYPFGELPAERLSPGVIYGCARYLCETQDELEAHKAGRTRRRDLPLMMPRYRGADGPPVVVGADKKAAVASAKACLGYFQLFRYYPGQTFGSFKTGGKYDLEFRNAFKHRVGLWDFYVLHLGRPKRANWQGRIVPKWEGR